MRVVALAVVVLAAFVAAAPYTFLPSLLEGRVASSLQSGLGTETPPEVTLRSEPRWRMLLGEFSGGSVELGRPSVGGIRPDRVALALDPFDVDVIRSVTGRALWTERPLSGTIEAGFSEGTLSRIARENVEDYPITGVGIRDGLLAVEADAEVLGVPVPLSVGGRPDVAGGAFVFRPESVRAMGVEVPEEIVDPLLAGTDFRYPLEDLPYGPLMDEARVEDGMLVVGGRVEDVFGEGGQGATG